MADDKLKAGPESPGEGSVGDAQTVTRPTALETVEEPAAGPGPVRQPEQSVTPGMGGDVPAQPAPQVEADNVEKSPDQDKKVEPEEKAAKRRGRPLVFWTKCPEVGKRTRTKKQAPGVLGPV